MRWIPFQHVGGNAQQLPHLGGQRSLDVPLLRPPGPEPVLRHLGPALLQAVEGDRQAGEGPAEEEEVAAEESRLIRETSEVVSRQKFVVSFFFQSSTFRHNFYFWSRSRLGSNFFSRFFKNFWRLRRSRIRIINWFFRDSTLTCVCLLWTGQLLSHTCYEQVMSKAALNHESGGRLAGSMFGKFQGVRLILWPISPHYLRVDIKVLT